MLFGQHKQYFWIEWKDNSIFLDSLLNSFPQIVLGKYLVNTVFDSGSIKLTFEEIEQGWRNLEKTTASPKIENVSDIPHCQYDEWYVFDEPTYLKNYEVFINFGGFSLIPESEVYQEITKKFWQQIFEINPKSYLAEGDYLIFVTKNESLFNQIISKTELFKTP